MRKNRFPIVFAMVVAFSLGCLAGPSVQEAAVPAANAGGMAPGDGAAFRECTSIILGTNDANWIANNGQPKADRVVAVPSGWTPVGGGFGPRGNVGIPVVVVCR
jgi:hypothetical protein